VTNFFGFSVVIIGLYFFLIPAFMYTLEFTQSEPQDETNPHLLTQQHMMLIVVAGIGIFLTWKVASWWIADSAYAKAQGLKRAEQYTDAYQTIVQATALRVDEPVYHDERATIAAAVSSLALEQKEATLAAQLAKEAVDESSKALEISPQNVNFWKSRTRILYQFSSFDPAFTQNALDSILVAQQLAPTDAKIAYNVAVLYGETGKTKETIEMLNKTIALKPDYRDAYIALAIYYQKDKQLDKARETLELLLKRVSPNDTEAKQRLEELK
jgi:tetratricopeptide (TPR) repeat protein